MWKNTSGYKNIENNFLRTTGSFSMNDANASAKSAFRFISISQFSWNWLWNEHVSAELLPESIPCDGLLSFFPILFIARHVLLLCSSPCFHSNLRNVDRCIGSLVFHLLRCFHTSGVDIVNHNVSCSSHQSLHATGTCKFKPAPASHWKHLNSRSLPPLL